MLSATGLNGVNLIRHYHPLPIIQHHRIDNYSMLGIVLGKEIVSVESQRLTELKINLDLKMEWK